MATTGSGVDHFLVDAGLVVYTDIEHINAKLGFEKNEYIKSKREFKLDFVDSTERSRTTSTT